MIKLQTFAKEQCVTDRQVQRLVKKYEIELEGLYERRGIDGTWLSDEACEFLKGKMRQKAAEVYDASKDLEIEQLKEKVEELYGRLERKDFRIERLEGRLERKEEALELAKKELQLIEEKGKERIDEAVKEAEDKLSLELGVKHQKEIQRVREEERGKFRKGLFGFYRKIED